MQLNLSGKTALITGSSKGIGFIIAQTLHAEGCKVALNSRNSDDLINIKKKLPGSIGVAGDVTKPIEAQRIISDVLEIFGKIDIVVCNVGNGQSILPGNETPEEWERMIALNLWSATNIVESARNALADSKGVIVCISSICGLDVIPNAPITYSVAKAALHAYVRGISKPLGKQGIRINAIASGNILFDGSVWSRKLKDNPSAVEAMLKKDVALGCLGSPYDVANLVVYLVSARAAFATGSIWTIDGGQAH